MTDERSKQMEKNDAITDPVILFVKPRAITPKDKKTLKSAGILVIEVEDPNGVKLTRASSEISGGEMLMAAVDAIQDGVYDGIRVRFANAICEAIKAKAQSS